VVRRRFLREDGSGRMAGSPCGGDFAGGFLGLGEGDCLGMIRGRDIHDMRAGCGLVRHGHLRSETQFLPSEIHHDCTCIMQDTILSKFK
jgi:hypothetical protein